MHLRTFASLLSFSLPCALLALACESESTPSSTPALDSGTSGYDAGTHDTSAPDASTPDVAAPVDAADASDAADAAPVTALPFATGLGASGMALADGQVDPHWTVKDGNGTTLTAYVQTDALGYAGYWLAPSATSKFISPFSDTVDPSGNGTFTYATTFVLGPEVTVANVQLVIRYASDNAMTGITLNGQALASVTAGGYGAFETRTETTGFVTGTNTIAFTVSNSGGPTGMRAELDLTK